MIIRNATPDDAVILTQIYNHEVETGTALWNVQAIDLENRLEFLSNQKAKGNPVLVAEVDGEMAGYATYAAFRPQDGFHLTAEHSIYLRPGFQGQGIGPKLLSALIDKARDNGLHVLVAAIDGANEGSIALHQKLGFAEVGRMPQAGMKFGRWLDLVLLQLQLDDRSAP